MPNENVLDDGDVVVAPAVEPNVKMELAVDPTAEVVTAEVVGKPKAVGPAEVLGRPKVVGATKVAGKLNAGAAAVGTPNTAGADCKPKDVGATVALFRPKVGVVVVVDGTPKVADGTAVWPPKLKDGAAVGLNSLSEDVGVGPPAKLKDVDIGVGANEELLEVSASFSIVPVASFKLDFSAPPNENIGFVWSLAPNENVGAELTGPATTTGAAGFFPRTSITLPVSSTDALESGIIGA